MLFGAKKKSSTIHVDSLELSFLKNMIVPTFVLDAARKVVLWNDPMARLTGVPADSLIGTSDHWKAFYDSPRPCLADLLFDSAGDQGATLYSQQKQASGKARAAENWCAMPALGRRLYLSINASAVHDADGRLVAVVETILDETSREEARAALEAEREAQAKHFTTLSGCLTLALSRLAAGDLSHAIGTALPGETDRLRDDYHSATARLSAVLADTSKTVATIHSSAAEISNATENLSRRTEQQAATLQETAASLDQVTRSVQETAERTGFARQVVSTTKAAVERSGQVVKSAVEAMDGVEASSRKIGTIISVIDEIAFQTNLLALNAGVEAARAGEAGRGFAVVASEVRSLAQRSAEAAREIKTLIAAANDEVRRGVELVAETGHSLEQVIGHSAEMDGIVEHIAKAAKEEATSLQEVNLALRQMDQVIQQNAAMAEETTAATHALQDRTADLETLLRQFVLRPREHASIRRAA